MSESTVLYEAADGLAIITLNRPEARNALSSALMRDLTRALEQATGDASVRAVILTGAGDAFCAGVDLKEFGSLDGETPAGSRLIRSLHAQTDAGWTLERDGNEPLATRLKIMKKRSGSPGP